MRTPDSGFAPAIGCVDSLMMEEIVRGPRTCVKGGTSFQGRGASVVLVSTNERECKWEFT